MKKFSALFLFFILSTFISNSYAQLSVPNGDSIAGVVHLQIGSVSAHVALMARGWYVAADGHAPDVMHLPAIVPDYIAPRKGYPDQFILVWTDLARYKIYQSSINAGSIRTTEIFSDSIVGLGIYAPTSYFVKGSASIYADVEMNGYDYFCVKRPGASAWVLDTAGIGRRAVWKYELDTAGNVYANPNSSGLYYQSANGTPFTKVTTLADTYLGHIIINRHNRILVTGAHLYLSYDAAASWDTIFTQYPGDIIHEDKFGNLYAYDFTRLYRSTDTGTTWVRIDMDITGHSMDTFVSKKITGLIGDSVLYASTAWGVFTSSDQGDTWHADLDGVGSSPDGYWHFDNGRQVAATRLGLFAKNAGDPTWTKTFPTARDEYLRMGKIQGDTAGNIYTMMKWQDIQMPIKSTDQGATWLFDTLGWAELESTMQTVFYNTYFIAENGTTLIATEGPFSAHTGYLTYKRLAGGTFQPDTIGMTNRNFIIYTSAFYGYASDHSGSYYMSIGRSPGTDHYFVWHQPAGGGPWVHDSLLAVTGLFGGMEFSVMECDHQGSVIGCDPRGNIEYRYNSDWHQLPYPQSGFSSFAAASAVGGDGDDALFAGFYWSRLEYQDSKVGAGVGCTSDWGLTWHRVAGLDSACVKSFQTFGDTTYVLTSAGLYKMTCNGTVISPGVHDTYMAGQFLKVYPNPTSGECYVSFTEPLGEESYLTVQDLMGRKIKTIQLCDTISSFHTDDMPAGIYICTAMSGGKAVGMQKLIVEK
ncbi:MAG: hypothetical protein JWO03_799 [Bacteroidetes bacterium]|nr:hypothetical protein [Bacteroidota bacterium]